MVSKVVETEMPSISKMIGVFPFSPPIGTSVGISVEAARILQCEEHFQNVLDWGERYSDAVICGQYDC